jgi:hypothetical protein
MPPSGLEIIEYHDKKPRPAQGVQWQKLDPAEAKSEPLNQILHGEIDVIEAFLKTLR